MRSTQSGAMPVGQAGSCTIVGRTAGATLARHVPSALSKPPRPRVLKASLRRYAFISMSLAGSFSAAVVQKNKAGGDLRCDEVPLVKALRLLQACRHSLRDEGEEP